MIELKLVQNFPQEIIAVDEVGRGPLGGPVVIGAVRVLFESAENLKVFLKFLKSKGIKDSKKLSSADRLKVLQKLGVFFLSYRASGEIEFKGIKLTFTTWDMDHNIIDEENILGASLRGMKEAAQFLSKSKKGSTTILIDGPMKLRHGNKLSSWNEIPIIKGDSKSLLIGLASIIAKEKRDAFMRDMHEIYPQYGFNTHFGYPTSAHREAIKLHGPSPIHRKTFKGVREFVTRH